MNIVATSAGFNPNNRYGVDLGAVVNYTIDLAEKPRPKLCLLHTATGDSAVNYMNGYAAVSRERPDVEVTHLSLFTMPNVKDVREHLLSQDVIWVGGGSVANLLAVWKLHGLYEIFREAWEAGVILGGRSAGSLCWHAGGTTDSYGPDLQLVTDGLGLLPYSNTPHYSNDPQRRPLYLKLVGDGSLPMGWATDDGVGLHFRGTELVEAISERDNVYAWKVERGADGKVVESRIEPRRLPDL